MQENKLHIIMPVKDSIEMTERAIRAIVHSGHTLCIYDDNSSKENAQRLDTLADFFRTDCSDRTVTVQLFKCTSNPTKIF